MQRGLRFCRVAAASKHLFFVRVFCVLLAALILAAAGCAKRETASASATEVESGPAGDLTEIEKAGLKTIADLEGGRAAAWTARYYSKTGTPGFDVDVVRQGRICRGRISWHHSARMDICCESCRR